MAGRPKSFDVDEAIDAFVDVFWTNGYRGTSVDDLQDAAGIKRGSFYAAFGCKDDVFERVLEKYWNEATEVGLKILDEDKPPKQAVANFIRHIGSFMSLNTPRGCLLLSSSSETADAHSGEQSFVCSKMTELENRLLRTLERDGDETASLCARDQANFVLAVILGLNAMAKADCGSSRIRAAADYAARSIAS
ncbi:TetR/AcrR family transcriptional regulator [uncultured Roseibium sp.]|uniref:TetR/AcrR family transcriptional regulator n=1 Tax=uncultured Roseibium sp. TaxID=1936171 RepID=UPI00262879A2|nr:TetR/AcrR family transcriptional regulator [uncultured Roseibium sp.]